jgi:DNA-binding MarR family transcriptional regulator
MQKATEEDLRPVIDQFWETVPRVWNLIRSHLRTIAVEEFNISVTQFHILRLIRKGLTSIKDIAEQRQISRPAVSQAAELLVAKGLITRQEQAGDRRFVRLALTPAGEDLLNQLFQRNRAWMVEQMALANLEDLQIITQGLACLSAALDPREPLE